MRPLKLASAIVGFVLPLGLSAPVLADVAAVDDPAGDGLKGRRLDITSLRLSNRDHAIVARVSFVRAAAGDLAVWLQARGTKRKGVALVASVHRPKRGDRSFVRTAQGIQDCPGLHVTWDHEADTARVRLPSDCFRAGNYGAVRTRIITEIGSDADVAPEAPGGSDGDLRWRWSAWTDRG
jgi:hypothetical protein